MATSQKRPEVENQEEDQRAAGPEGDGNWMPIWFQVERACARINGRPGRKAMATPSSHLPG
ncbi:MAG: hypothetical protein ACYDAG_12675 [Chloroflexota bacterium]